MSRGWGEEDDSIFLVRFTLIVVVVQWRQRNYARTKLLFCLLCCTLTILFFMHIILPSPPANSKSCRRQSCLISLSDYPCLWDNRDIHSLSTKKHFKRSGVLYRFYDRTNTCTVKWRAKREKIWIRTLLVDKKGFSSMTETMIGQNQIIEAFASSCKLANWNGAWFAAAMTTCISKLLRRYTRVARLGSEKTDSAINLLCLMSFLTSFSFKRAGGIKEPSMHLYSLKHFFQIFWQEVPRFFVSFNNALIMSWHWTMTLTPIHIFNHTFTLGVKPFPVKKLTLFVNFNALKLKRLRS